jgi:hypothetical protein
LPPNPCLITNKLDFSTQELSKISFLESTEFDEAPTFTSINFQQLIEDHEPDIDLDIITHEDIINKTNEEKYKTPDTLAPPFCLVPLYLLPHLLAGSASDNVDTFFPEFYSSSTIFHNLYSITASIDKTSNQEQFDDIMRISTHHVPFLSQYILKPNDE